MISTAAIGDELVPAFRSSAGNELIAVASRDVARARAYAEEHGIPEARDSYRAILEDERIDAVYIPLPNALHGEWTRAALQSGKHVLCEKPLTPTADEAEQLFQLAAANRLVLAEAFMYRHHPKTQRVLELLSGGAIGELCTIRCSFNFRVADPQRDIRYSVELAGGALSDVGCYCVSYSTLAADSEPEEFFGFARIAPSGVDERFYGTLAFRSGTVAQFDCALDVPLNIGVNLVGTDGEIYVPMPWYPHREPLSVYVRRGNDVDEVPAPGENAYLLELDDIAAAIRGERTPRVTPAETVRNLRAIEALRAGARLASTRQEESFA
jgi:predicted dehydrogenase